MIDEKQFRYRTLRAEALQRYHERVRKAFAEGNHRKMGETLIRVGDAQVALSRELRQIENFTRYGRLGPSERLVAS